MNQGNLSKILSTKQPKVGRTVFISIDGHGGSGKSTLAKLLSQKLNAQIVHTDDFANWDNPLNWWSLIIERIFAPIEHGARKLNYPRSKWLANHNPKPVVDQPVTDIMILEGVSSLRKEFRKYISLGIYVEAPREICLRRGVARDNENGITKDEVEQMWAKWFNEEEQYIERDQPQKYADLILDGTKHFEEQISF